NHADDALKTVEEILRSQPSEIEVNYLQSFSHVKNIKGEVEVALDDTPDSNYYMRLDDLDWRCAIIRKLALDELKKRGISVD
ncbi:MAG TPA: hypothetical protein PLZ51_11985, partial [Aggregatilineales bacterium]|nr:hypothetical protein [Aggregatilineales bacterium]